MTTTLQNLARWAREEEMSEQSLATTLAIIRLLKPFELKGDTECVAVINAISKRVITPAAVKWRLKQGFYSEGVHYRNGGKMRLWNREAIIATELKKLKEDGYEDLQ